MTFAPDGNELLAADVGVAAEDVTVGAAVGATVAPGVAWLPSVGVGPSGVLVVAGTRTGSTKVGIPPVGGVWAVAS